MHCSQAPASGVYPKKSCRIFWTISLSIFSTQRWVLAPHNGQGTPSSKTLVSFATAESLRRSLQQLEQKTYQPDCVIK